MDKPLAPKRLGQLRWLAWNPLWLLIAAAWVALVVWAMRSKMHAQAEAELRQSQTQGQVIPGR